MSYIISGIKLNTRNAITKILQLKTQSKQCENSAMYKDFLKQWTELQEQWILSVNVLANFSVRLMESLGPYLDFTIA